MEHRSFQAWKEALARAKATIGDHTIACVPGWQNLNDNDLEICKALADLVGKHPYSTFVSHTSLQYE